MRKDTLTLKLGWWLERKIIEVNLNKDRKCFSSTTTLGLLCTTHSWVHSQSCKIWCLVKLKSLAHTHSLNHSLTPKWTSYWFSCITCLYFDSIELYDHVTLHVLCVSFGASFRSVSSSSRPSKSVFRLSSMEKPRLWLMRPLSTLSRVTTTWVWIVICVPVFSKIVCNMDEDVDKLLTSSESLGQLTRCHQVLTHMIVWRGGVGTVCVMFSCLCISCCVLKAVSFSMLYFLFVDWKKSFSNVKLFPSHYIQSQGVDATWRFVALHPAQHWRQSLSRDKSLNVVAQ